MLTTTPSSGTPLAQTKAFSGAPNTTVDGVGLLLKP